VDERLKIEIARVHRGNFGVYGIEKLWRQLKREGHKVGRDRVARLMDDLELRGVVRKKKKRTTIPDEVRPRPAELVERNFAAEAPNRLWVSDLTYVSTWRGFVYVALVIDVFSRFIVRWRVSDTLHAELALDALEQAIWRRHRQDLTGLVHHSDRGVQTGFKGSWQHRSQELRCSNANVGAQIAHCASECSRRVVHRRRVGRIANASGRALPRA
jgi:transposase InsO family protein